MDTVTVAGQMIGGIRLVRVLGRGAHSVVYLAVTQRGQLRAVKLFSPEMATYAQREYNHAGGLLHPNLIPVLAATVVGGQPALLMGYARGVTLFERYRRRPALGRERELFVLTISQVLDALAYLHERGLVHRDVKPDNIIVDEDGSAKLVDYDLCGPIGEDMGGPMQVGTPAFQSPEAARGEALGPESDLYSVGVLLYWGLHGQLPDPDEPAPPLDDLLCGLTEQLLEPEREKRRNDAAKIAQTLQRFSRS